jgi:exopolysaccharide biosynthesis polyprenyl glycosylphosphotransferase
VVNEEASRLSVAPAFGLEGNAVAFPFDAGVDLVALRSRIAGAGRVAVRVLLPVLDTVALTLAMAVTSSLTEFGVAWAVVTLAGLLLATRTHEPRLELRASRDAAGVIAWLALGLLGALALANARLEGSVLVRTAAFAFVFLIAARVIAYAAIHRIRAHHLAFEPTLIVGAGPLSTQLAVTLRDHPEFGLNPIGFVDARRVVSGAAMAVLGDYADLERVIRRYTVTRVIIGFGRNLDVVSAVRTCQSLQVRTHLIARGGDLGVVPEGKDIDHVMGLSLVRVKTPSLTRTAALRTKRAVDCAAAFAILTLTAPIFLAAAAAVRLSSPGPVLFRQRRIGRNGKPFDLLKFRSMRINADSDTTWSVAQDRRVTPVGRLLRKTSIDELPQLYNVLRGDMSLIGPRPERPHFVEQFGTEVPHYRDRHRAPVGISGWAQVHRLRGDTSIQERVRMDNYYVEHWSPWLDLVIILRTVGEVLGGASP